MTDTCRREILARGAAPEKVVTAPNGFDRFEPALATPILRGDGEFIIAYAGNMGVATGIEVLLDAAHRLRAEQKYRFVLVGGGAEGGSVARRVEGEQLDNVELLDRSRATSPPRSCATPMCASCRSNAASPARQFADQAVRFAFAGDAGVSYAPMERREISSSDRAAG